MKALILIVALSVAASSALAAPAKPKPAPQSISSIPSAVKPSKKLDFEDGVVEGLNKRPLDSFEQLSEADKRSKIPHLYKKRTDFAAETAETLKQVRYSQ